MAVRPVRWRVASSDSRRVAQANASRSRSIAVHKIDIGLARVHAARHRLPARGWCAVCDADRSRQGARDRCAVALLCFLYGLFDMPDLMQRTRIAIDACTELQLGVDGRL